MILLYNQCPCMYGEVSICMCKLDVAEYLVLSHVVLLLSCIWSFFPLATWVYVQSCMKYSAVSETLVPCNQHLYIKCWWWWGWWDSMIIQDAQSLAYHYQWCPVCVIVLCLYIHAPVRQAGCCCRDRWQPYKGLPGLLYYPVSPCCCCTVYTLSLTVQGLFYVHCRS